MNRCTRFLLVLALSLLGACEDENFLGEDIGEAIELRDPSTGLVDALGNIIESIDVGDPVTVQVPRLQASTEYVIRITDPNGVEYNPAGGLIASSDANGVIFQSTIVQNLDSGANNATLLAPEGRYRVTFERVSGAIDQTIDFDVENRSRVFCSDSGGSRRVSFTSAEDVFVRVERANGTLNDGNFDVHVLPDSSAVLRDGSDLLDAAGSITVLGGTGLVNLGTFDQGEQYDVVVDLNGNGSYDSDSDLISRQQRLHACFAIQNDNTGGPIETQIAADRSGNHKEVFDPAALDADSIRDMFARASADEQSAVAETLGVDLYLVTHRDAWANGAALVDSSSVVETAPAQEDSMHISPWLVWPSAEQQSGCYDLVVDVNRNGAFDHGIDLIDNLDENGANDACGVRIADTSCAGNVRVTNQESVFTTDLTAITVEAAVSGTPMAGSISVVSGDRTSGVTTLDGSSPISQQVTLFPGLNFVTLAYYFAGDVTCARTLTVLRV